MMTDALTYGEKSKKKARKRIPSPPDSSSNVKRVYAHGRIYTICAEVICGSCSTTDFYAVQAGLGGEQAFLIRQDIECHTCHDKMTVGGPVQGKV